MPGRSRGTTLRIRSGEKFAASGAGIRGPAPLISQYSTIRRIPMSTSTENEAKGTFHEVKGEIKKKVGQVTNNAELEAEGNVEHQTGKVEKKVGQIKKD